MLVTLALGLLAQAVQLVMVDPQIYAGLLLSYPPPPYVQSSAYPWPLLPKQIFDI
jgi:hypothetical protein